MSPRPTSRERLWQSVVRSDTCHQNTCGRSVQPQPRPHRMFKSPPISICWGVLLWELWQGKRPFSADGANSSKDAVKQRFAARAPDARKRFSKAASVYRTDSSSGGLEIRSIGPTACTKESGELREVGFTEASYRARRIGEMSNGLVCSFQSSHNPGVAGSNSMATTSLEFDATNLQKASGLPNHSARRSG